MSVDMDEFAKQLNEEIKREACEKNVPIYPVRYTIKESQEADMVNELLTSYPTLKWSNYALRTVRLGYIYLFDETKGEEGLRVWLVLENGQFQEIKIKSKASIKDLAPAIYGLKPDFHTYLGDSTPYVLAPAKSTKVHIGFSDVLWTPFLTQKIIDNKKGIRDKLMVEINVKSWQEDSPLKETFKMSTINELVEEYKDEEWKKNSLLPTSETSPAYEKYETLCNIMSSVPTCEKKIIGVKLYDNIGLVKDLRLLIKKFQKAHYSFMHDENALHKKLISNFIEIAYKQEVSQKHKKPFKEVYEEGLWDDDAYFVDNKSTISVFTKTKKLGVDEEQYKDKFFEKNAPKRVELINEKARKSFLKYFNKRSKKLSEKVMEAKNDCAVHVAHLFKTDMNIHLGTSFLNYDRSYDLETESCGKSDKSAIVSTYLSSQSLASCIDGMMSNVSKVGTLPNYEQEQFDILFKEEDKLNLLYEVFIWSQQNKIDSLSSLLGFTSLITYGSEEKNQQAIEKAKEKRSKEIQKRKELKYKIEKRQQKIARLERTLELQKSATQEMSAQRLHRELSQIEKEKHQKHRDNEAKLEKKLNREKKKLAKLNEKSEKLEQEQRALDEKQQSLNKKREGLKEESYDNRRKQKAIIDDLKTKRIILNEKNLELNAYSQQVVKENISLYILSRKHIGGASLTLTFNKLAKILEDKENNINLLLPQFEEWNSSREKKGKKRVVRKLEVSYDLYMQLFYTTKENHTHIDNKRLHVKNNLLNENKKLAFFIVVDDETLLKLQQYIPILEQEILTIKSKLGKHNKSIKTAKDIEEVDGKIAENQDSQDLNRDKREALKTDVSNIDKEIKKHHADASLSTREIEQDAHTSKANVKEEIYGKLKSDIERLEEVSHSKVEQLDEEIAQYHAQREESSNKIALAKKELAQTFQYWVMGVNVSTNTAVSIMNIFNLKLAYDGIAEVHAINSDSSNKEILASWTNFMGAIMGTVSAVYGTSLTIEQATKIKINPSSQLRRTAGAVVVRGVVIEALERKATIWGIVAGVADFLTAVAKAWIEFEDENNSESGTYYLIAGTLLIFSVGLPVAGIFIEALAFFTGIVGIVAMLALTVVGLIFYMWADEAKWKAIDKWLSGCFFRTLNDDNLARGKGLVVYHPNVMYEIKMAKEDDREDKYNKHPLSNTKQKKEILGFFEAISEPKITVEWESNFLSQDVSNIVNKTLDIMSGYPSETKIASIKISIEFPLILDVGSFRYGINASTPNKPSLHEIAMKGGVNHYRWTTAEFTGSKFTLDIRHVSNHISRMNLGLSFKLAIAGELQTIKLYYKIDRDNSYQRLN